MGYDFTSAGIKEGALKLLKIIGWVAGAAVVNFLFQYLTGLKFHDIAIHIKGFEYIISDDVQNLAMTAFLNGAGAGFVKWVNTKKDEAIKE